MGNIIINEDNVIESSILDKKLSLMDFLKVQYLVHISDEEHAFAFTDFNVFLQYLIDNAYLEDSYKISINDIIEHRAWI